MNLLVSFLITWVVLTLAFIIVTYLPTGVESDSFQKTAIAALVFGLLNGVAQFLLGLPVLGGLLWLVTLGTLLLNLILFALAAKLVVGFRLKWGIVSAILGSIALTIVWSILNVLI